MRITTSLYSLNRGIVSRLGLARMDVKRLAMAAQVQTNFMPRVLGSMMLRPGTKFIGATSANAATRLLKFIFSTNDTALLEMTSLQMRVWINDALLTRPSVATTVANGDFTGSLASWTSHDEAGATSSWLANSQMLLQGTGTNYAIREQQVTVAAGDHGKEHGIRIVIAVGPVTLRMGSTSGADDYQSETHLGSGTHSLSITPTTDIFIRFQSRSSRVMNVTSCHVEAAGPVAVTAPWAAADLGKIRTDQSADAVYVACAGYQQRIIQRRGTRPNARSWSIIKYEPLDGPFMVLNTTPTTIQTTGITGSILLSSSRPVFKPTHVGALLSLTSSSQAVTKTSSASGDSTSSIRVIGVATDRTFSIDIAGDATGSTVNLQRSYDNATWTNVGSPHIYTANASDTYADGLNNQIVYYRLNLTTRVAPDSVVMTLRYGLGSIRGVVKLDAISDESNASGNVVADLGQTFSTADWQLGQWSDDNGWPTSVKFHEGRLWWFGQNGVWGSISDAFDSFDETFIGNAGPINRTIGSGPVDTINWGLSLKGLLLGAQGAEMTARSSSLDEPLTPTNFNVKTPSTQGSGTVDAVKIDQSGYFVNRAGIKIFELAFDLRTYDYNSSNLMELAPDIGRPGIIRMDAQRLPDTRLHCVRSDGVALVAVINKTEDVLAWIPIQTQGTIEDVVVLPALDGKSDDQVYYVVNRTINGATVRYIEKWAQEIDCLGDKPLCDLADSYVEYSGVATTSIPVAHLEGQPVVVWADGADVGTVDTARPWTQKYTVSGGHITLAVAASNVVVGLPYTAQFQSAKLGEVAQGQSPLNQQKKIDHIGLVLANTHTRGLKFGPTLDDTGSLRMDDMPQIEDGVAVAEGMYTDYDQNLIEFPGLWTTDSRVCLQAQAPRPATVLAITLSIQQNT